ncbi:hypothetical protein PSNIH1_03410 [Pantoea sp. PSNIH1]|nr:hypothetical protein PSNIH1_03410 [Pantoea sp. PSNIH1]
MRSQTHFAGFFIFVHSVPTFFFQPACAALARRAHVRQRPSRAMLSPPRLPALCSAFNADA